MSNLLLAILAIGGIICLLALDRCGKIIDRCELAKKINHEFAEATRDEVDRKIINGPISTAYLSWNVNTFIHDFKQNTLDDVLTFLKKKAEKNNEREVSI